MNPVPSNVNGCALIVDDDKVARDALRWLLRSRDIASVIFESGQEFLNWLELQAELSAACVVLDVRMPGMSGIEVFDAMVTRKLHDSLPVIMLTGHGDVPMAVEALKKGAYDFFQKPFTDNVLVDRIAQGIEVSRLRVSEGRNSAQTQSRLESLTDREKGVLQLIIAGRLNKVIADELGISMRTVEVHRARIFAKMGVRSAVELSNLLNADAPKP